MEADSAKPRPLTAAQVAERFDVAVDTVLAWIKRGELIAVNVAVKAKGRSPRWRIMPEALAEFERSRTSQPKAEKQPRRKRPSMEGIEEFY